MSSNERREAWARCLELWRNLLEKVRKKEDFSDDEIESFQAVCDHFLLPGLSFTKKLELGTTYI